MKTKTTNRKLIIAVITAALMISAFFAWKNINIPLATNSTRVGTGIFTVTSEKKREVRFDKASGKLTALTIPESVQIGNKTYSVVSIKSGALKNNKNLKTLVIGENVKTIGKKAFYNCKNLKSITIKTQVLTSVGSNAFGKIYSKAVAVMSKMTDEKEVKYVDMLDKKGKLLDRNQTLKVKNFVGIPNPEVNFAIGEPSGKNYAFRGDKNDFNRLWVSTTTDADFMVGEYIPLSLSIKMPHEIYGSWSVKRRKVMKQRERCICKKYFDACTDNLGNHIGQSGHGAIAYTRNWLYGKEKRAMWYWSPDMIPCSVKYSISLPTGISYCEGSVTLNDVTKMGILKPVSNDKYTVAVNGNNVIITVKDIKLESDNGAIIHPFVAIIKAKVDESAADVNQVNADISYSFGKINKTLNMNPVTIRKK